jgi:DNA-binding protein YbaB
LLKPAQLVIHGESSPEVRQTQLDGGAELDATVQGSAGGGVVTATVDATGELIDLVIAPEVFADGDEDLPQVVADLVIAAVRDAQAARLELLEEEALDGFAQLGPLGALAEQMAGMLPPGFLTQLSGSLPQSGAVPGDQPQESPFPQSSSVPAGMPDLSGLLAGLPGLMQGLQSGASEPASQPDKPDDGREKD